MAALIKRQPLLVLASHQSGLSHASQTRNAKSNISQLSPRAYSAGLQCGLRYQSTSVPSREDWPNVARGRVPTPYEIFNQQRGAPYSKKRFYELVKIYHPDRQPCESVTFTSVSQATRLERYRLVVAANEILSDPARRSAYDRWGAGWHTDPARAPSQAYRASYNQAGGFNGFSSSANNATWEDWERWRQGQQQQPIHVSNGVFVVLVVSFALAGALGEFTRAQSMSKSFLRQVEIRHEEASRELKRARAETQRLDSQGERVQSFLRTRDPDSYMVPAPKAKDGQKASAASELCLSGAMESKSSRSA